MSSLFAANEQFTFPTTLSVAALEQLMQAWERDPAYDYVPGVLEVCPDDEQEAHKCVEQATRPERFKAPLRVVVNQYLDEFSWGIR